MIFVIQLHGESTSSRLEPNEVIALFTVLSQIHDHDARTPAVPVWWERFKDMNPITRVN